MMSKETEISALQALMQIRSNPSSGEGTGIPMETRTDAANASAATAAAAAANVTNANFSNLLRLGASPGALLHRAQLNLTSRQFAAAAASYNYARGKIMLSADMHQQQSPSFSSAVQNPYTPPLTSVNLAAPQQQTAISPLLLTGRNLESTALAKTSAANPQEKPEEKDTKEEKNIRKQEVEAALRSKPQRGRKRENLNAEERLELTRTRNREHAKSTRIRKKARYEELLDREQKYLEHQQSQELDVKRRQTVNNFLRVRGLMLNEIVNASSGSGKEVLDNEKKTEGSDYRHVSFDHSAFTSMEQAAAAKAGTSDDREEITMNLQDLLENGESFQFETSLVRNSPQGLELMRFLDNDISRRCEMHFGARSETIKVVYYRVVGSDNGVAISPGGCGFAKVELVASLSAHDANAASTCREEEVLLVSLVSFQFAAESSKLSQVAWSVLSSLTGDSPCGSVNDGSKSDSTARESLESQIVYPSVVSFDDGQRGKGKLPVPSQSSISRDQEESADNEDSEDPGMSIG